MMKKNKSSRYPHLCFLWSCTSFHPITTSNTSALILINPSPLSVDEHFKTFHSSLPLLT